MKRTSIAWQSETLRSSPAHVLIFPDVIWDILKFRLGTAVERHDHQVSLSLPSEQHNHQSTDIFLIKSEWPNHLVVHAVDTSLFLAMTFLLLPFWGPLGLGGAHDASSVGHGALPILFSCLDPSQLLRNLEWRAPSAADPADKRTSKKKECPECLVNGWPSRDAAVMWRAEKVQHLQIRIWSDKHSKVLEGCTLGYGIFYSHLLELQNLVRRPPFPHCQTNLSMRAWEHLKRVGLHSAQAPKQET